MKRFKIFTTFFLLLLAIPFFLTPYSLSQEDKNEEYWMGIYSGDKRVGYSYNSIKTGKEFTEVKELTNLRVNLLGKDNEVYTEGTYKLEGYKILSFEYEMKSDSINLKAAGKRDGKNLKITMDSVSGITERILTIKQELILPSLVSKLLVQNKFTSGDKFTFILFEPLYILMGTNEPLSTHIIGGKEIVNLKVGKHYTYRVNSNFMGTEFTSWINDKGEVIKQEFPPGLTSFRETKEDILGNSNSSFDIVQETSISTKMKLKNPDTLKNMKIKLSGINVNEWADINDGNRQKLDGQTLEINTQGLTYDENSYDLPYESPEHQQLIQADFLIQSNDEEIIAITKKVIDGEMNPGKAAKKINNWIYKNLKKSATASLPNAKDVLKTRVGDCNEHAALFSAMSRAAGIPTKTVLGLVYFNDSFAYHAWNEVYIGKWIAIDSTFGQFPVDATHIKFIEGNFAKSGEISKLVGKLNIEIIDAS